MTWHPLQWLLLGSLAGVAVFGWGVALGLALGRVLP